jgi:hypothetical protein
MRKVKPLFRTVTIWWSGPCAHAKKKCGYKSPSGLLEAMQKENNFPDPVVSTKCFSPQIAELEDFVF